jgi:hypothetical protein
MGQVGVVSAAQLALHDHGDLSSGGADNLFSRTDSATVKITNATLRTTANTIFTRMKQIVVLGYSAGSMRVLFTLERTGAAGTVDGQVRIYRAGTAIFTGADFSEIAGPTVESELGIAQDLQPMDSIEVWGSRTGAGTICSISDMSVRYTTTITTLSRVVLTTPLAVTGMDIPYTIVS